MTSPIAAAVNARLDLRAGAQKLGGKGRCSEPFKATTSAVLIGNRWMATARTGKHIACLSDLPHEGRSMQTTRWGGHQPRNDHEITARSAAAARMHSCVSPVCHGTGAAAS
jgi:hypothetical protein